MQIDSGKKEVLELQKTNVIYIQNTRMEINKNHQQNVV